MDEIAIFEGLERVFRSGSRQARASDQARIMAATLEVMADEAKRVAKSLEARHD